MTQEQKQMNKIQKIFRTASIFDVLPANKWWEDLEPEVNENAAEDEEEEESVKEVDENPKNQRKFKSLEHNGVQFPAAYKPHGVSILFKGEPVSMNPFLEEIATFWGSILESDLSTKEIPRKNFFAYFKEKLRESSDEYKSKFANAQLEDFDFTPISEIIQANRLKNKNRPKEEKLQEKLKKQELNAKYGIALVDNFPEKISNFMVEPPGIYRGRGDHPGCGRIKPRITPEEVTINVGPDDVVPICTLPGHCWKEILNNTQSTWLAMYKEDKHTKYMFLAGNSKFKGKNDLKKYEKARKLKSLISTIREDYYKQMNSNSTEKKQLGVATYLIDILALRVGNEKGDDEADTVGCCSLRVEHVSFNPEDHEKNNHVTFDFLGKDSMRYLNTVELDPIVVKCMRQFTLGKKKEDDLFDLINVSM